MEVTHVDLDTGSIRCTTSRHPDLLKSMFSSFIDDMEDGNLQHPSRWKVTNEDPTHTESSDEEINKDCTTKKANLSNERPSKLQRIK